MNILFTRFPLESADGGAENQTEWLMEGLRSRGHDVLFLGSCPVLLRRAKKLGIAHTRLDIGPPPVTKSAAISFFWRRKAMKTGLVKALSALPRQPDAIIMLSLSEKILLSEYAASRGIRVLWVEHDRVGAWLRRNPWLPALKRASAHATIVCVSELSRRIYLGLGFDPSRVIAIPNGVPPPPLTPSPPIRQAQGTLREGEQLLLGCIARLSKEKGIDVLLQAIAEMPDVTLHIIGRGPEEGYLRTLIAEDTRRLGLAEPRITITRSLPDLSSFYQSIDVLVLPSTDHDPFGLAAAEAMMHGTAVIVTDACGIAEYLIDGENALIAKAGSPISLTEQIRKLSDRVAREQIALQGRKAAQEKFSLDTMTEAYISALFSSEDSDVRYDGNRCSSHV